MRSDMIMMAIFYDGVIPNIYVLAYARVRPAHDCDMEQTWWEVVVILLELEIILESGQRESSEGTVQKV